MATSARFSCCIRNPLEGKPLAADDPQMAALLADIAYERRGVKLALGKPQR
jgi:thiosulfate dehydrogenase